MHIAATYSWPDGSSIDVIVDDSIDNEYNPIRTAEMTSYTRDLLRNVVTDVEHRNAEHEQP